MKDQPYFIVVLAHSFHGRLRRLHVPQQAVYTILVFALLGVISAVGAATSYARMVWKVANYNSLREEIDTLRNRYAQLQKSADQTNQQLVTLQMLAGEVQIAFGVKQHLDGPPDISAEGPLLPTFDETIEQYDFLKSARLSRTLRRFPRMWQTNIQPSLWPLHGRLLSSFGHRTDPFSGEGAFHTGIDLAAPIGTPVRTTADGIVSVAEWWRGYGKLVVVDHGNGLSTYYAHLSRIDVVAGQEVRRSSIIGATGATGRATSPHLHYEVRRGGNPINPYTFLARYDSGETPQRDLPF